VIAASAFVGGRFVGANRCLQWLGRCLRTCKCVAQLIT